MALHVIVGKGPVGTTTAAELVGRGHRVRVLSRSGGTSTDSVEHRRVDAADAEALVRAAEGAAALYNAVNPAYSRWPVDWPPVAGALLTAAERTGAVLVTTGNLYGYGRPTGPMTPETPLAATDVKGRVRNRMWADEVRGAGLGDPHPAGSSHLVRQLPALRAGRRAWVVGDPDVRRSWAYLPDVAATLATLGTDERALGRAWHVPTTEPRTQRQALTDLATAMSLPPATVSGVPWPLLRAIGLAVPTVREVVAIQHQWDQEYVSDGSATTDTFGLTATPWDEVVRATAAAVPVPA
jgi:nucleoside-diphosphate-sugar epimerase